ncbi:hypothetical protein FRX31_023102 [Thalictrum thalictroides]|uniref:Uncharacterized protein n=1 Tax=Thalictrum thalictroides TaxID=46969 RepID=A0A7J6VQF3_THATH|nr:hypothetical protein FRX31_023102 [Thalictrum thalictroides]
MADVEMMTIANYDAEEKVLLEENETVMGRRVSSRLKAKEKRPYYGNNTRSKKTRKPKSMNEAEGSKVIEGSIDLMDQGLKEEDVIGGEGNMHE